MKGLHAQPHHPMRPAPFTCLCTCVFAQTSEFGLQFSTVGWKQYLTALKSIGLASLLSSRIERPYVPVVSYCAGPPSLTPSLPAYPAYPGFGAEVPSVPPMCAVPLYLLSVCRPRPAGFPLSGP